MFMGLSKCKIN